MNYVSIIVTHYSQRDDFLPESNLRSQFLRQCMDSLIKNTTYPAELIVIDNGGKNDDSDYLVDLTRQGKINTYIRNKNNMYWAYGWNQGVKMATGKYILLTHNDYIFKPNWLEKTIYPLLKYPDKRLIACPMLFKNKYNIGKLEDYRLDSFGMPACLLLTKELFYKVGEYPVCLLSSPYWLKKVAEKGYVFIAPPTNYVKRIGVGHCLDPSQLIKVEKELLTKQKIDLHEKGTYYRNKRISWTPHN